MQTSLGWIELVACNNRGEHDLGGHERLSGQEMTVLDDGERVLPNVFELSMGIDRSLYCILENSLHLVDNRVILKLPPHLAPIQAAILPLLSRKPFTDEAMRIYRSLRQDFDVVYDESGSIGRRYARYDEVGVPVDITIDHQTLEDKTVTVRFRDSTIQLRVRESDLRDFLSDHLKAV